jgi:hypothetical protein
MRQREAGVPPARTRALALAVCFVLSACLAWPSPARATPFADVPSDHWAYQAIQSLAADGMIDG